MVDVKNLPYKITIININLTPLKWVWIIMYFYDIFIIRHNYQIYSSVWCVCGRGA